MRKYSLNKSFKLTKVILLFCLIGSFLFLSGCNLEVEESTSPQKTTSALETQSNSMPVGQNSSTATASHVTTPETTSSIPETQPVTQTPAVTTPVSTIFSGEDARTILQQSADAMLAVESYHYTAISSSNFGEQNLESETDATIFPAKGDGRITSTQGDISSTTYLKNNRMYMLDPISEQWVYMDMPKDSETEPVTIHKRVNDYMTVIEHDNQYLLTSNHPLSALEFYSLTGIELQQKDTLDVMDSQGQTMETLVEFVLDENFRYVNVSYEQVITTGGISTYTFSSYDYSDYNQAEEVIIPDEILVEAQPVDSQSGN